MRIAIAMRSFEQQSKAQAEAEATPECFAEFEVEEGEQARSSAAGHADEDVQVTVVLRGKRGELENPALGMTELVLRAIEGRDRPAKRDVIDVAGIAVEPIRAAG
jgi:hypothetical protein